jgi:hypothetical protein
MLHYLGIYLDGNLTRRNHVEKTAEKMLYLRLSLYKLNVLNRLAGSKCSSSRSVFTATYKAFIKPALQCSSDAF